MARSEEIVNNIGYKMTRAALEYIEKHEFADAMDAFEAGAEWMQEKMIEKACEVLKNHLFTQVVGRYDGEYSQFIQEVYTQVFPKFATAEDMIMVLRKEMEE